VTHVAILKTSSKAQRVSELKVTLENIRDSSTQAKAAEGGLGWGKTTGGLGDGSPPAGSTGGAPVGLGTKLKSF